MKTALVAGANGIAGRLLLKYLKDAGFQCIGVAKSKKGEVKEAKMIFADMMKKDELNEKLSSEVKNVTHLYYCAWQPADSEEEKCKVNKQMFENMLDVVESNANDLQHVYLQTGTKYYGVHVGPDKGYKIPSMESDSRLSMPNFYYDQEDVLKQRQKGKKWTWSVARPDAIIGYSEDTAMNFGVTLAVYACILKEMGKPLVFPSSKAWNKIRTFTDAHLLCKAILWMSTNPNCANQEFNINNGDMLRWDQLWPRFAKRFGMKYEVSKEEFDVEKFMEDKDNLWKEIVKKNQLQDYDLSQLATWDFLKFYLTFPYDNITSVTKLKKCGFNDFVDTADMFDNFFTALQNQKIIPKVTTEAAT